MIGNRNVRFGKEVNCIYIPTLYIQNIAYNVCTFKYANMCTMSDEINDRTV